MIIRRWSKKCDKFSLSEKGRTLLNQSDTVSDFQEFSRIGNFRLSATYGTKTSKAEKNFELETVIMALSSICKLLV